jgi:bifunctional non-homologous end joining protein LigD
LGRKKKVKKVSKINSGKLKEAPTKPYPHNVKPMLATLVKEPFNDKDWIFEIKLDGYRAVAEIEKGKINLHSRNNLSFNTKFAPITESLKAIDQDVILDGEIVVLDEGGISRFQAIQNYQRTGEGNLVYFVFDIIYLDGHDLTGLELIKRKELLKDLLPDLPNILYSEHIAEKGKDFFEAASGKKLEGIIAKDGRSSYQTGRRSRSWLKIKTSMRQEAVIGGFTEPRGSRKHLGSLVLGIYDGDDFIYIGHSGGGFTDASLKEIKNKLKPLIRKTSPFKTVPKTNSPVKWITPSIVCEVSFSEWTGEGVMRHPIFEGLREDKDAKEVVKEKPEDEKKMKNKSNKKTSKTGHGSDLELTVNRKKIKISNPDKIYFPEEGYTKLNMIEYYRKVSKYILPYLKNRPESLHRHPNGINGKSFFHKDVGDMPPEWIKTKKIYSESADKNINYLVCNNEASLLYIVNLGCIEINPWFSRITKPDNPDYLVLDLDPVDINFEKVVETALAVKEVLDSAGGKSYCKTSGSRGLHIYVPLNAKYDYDTAKEFAHIVAKIVNKKIPKITSLERSPSKRKKKVYLDYLQNRRGQTLAAPYSIRPKPGATVAAPLEWDEVKKGLSPKDFTIDTIHKRLAKKGDIFKNILGKGIDIKKSLSKLEKLL